MSEFTIERIYGREILDSRGRPTAEAEVTLSGGATGRAAVPSGASTGSREALELRDGEKARFNGRGVQKVVNNINGEISKGLIGRDARQQREIDNLLIELDGSPDNTKSRLGANAVLAVSLALAHASAAQMGLPLYSYIRQHLYPRLAGNDEFLFPVPLMNFINGGAHADNALDFQEYMLVPHGAQTFPEAMQWASEVYRTFLTELRKNRGRAFSATSFGVGDEGGFSIRTEVNLPPRDLQRFALDLLTEVVEKAGHSMGREGDFAFAMDPAASEFFIDGEYVLGRKSGQVENWSSEKMLEFYEGLVNDYPVISIEDGMGENDEKGWKMITERIGTRCQLVGDDYFVTNPALLKEGIKQGIANSILVKVNQIGTLTESLDVVEMAQKAGYTAVISHRSGETEDTTISDIAVATNAGQIKTGCISRGDRVAKYNRLLWIANEVGDQARYDGRFRKHID